MNIQSIFHKRNNKVSAGNTVVSGDLSNRLNSFTDSIRRINRKTWLIAGLVLCLVLVLAGIILVLGNNKSTTVKNSQAEKSTSGSVGANTSSSSFEGQLNNAEQQASAVQGTGSSSYQDAMSDINKITVSPENNEQQADLLIGKAVVAENFNQYADELRFAQQAEAIAPSNTTAYLIAESAQALGQKALAIEYYKKAIARTPVNNGSAAADIRDYQQAISQLGG